MKYFIDTEFLEGPQKGWFGKTTKPTIDLISVGIVCEDGREYYAISKDFNLKEAWNRYDLKVRKDYANYPKKDIGNILYKKEYWLRDNVLEPIYKELHRKENLHAKQALHRANVYIAETEFKFTLKNLKRLINKYGKTNKQISEEIVKFTKVNICFKNVNYNQAKSNPEIFDAVRPQFYGYYSDYDWVVFCWLFGRMIDLPKGFPMFAFDIQQQIEEYNIDKKLLLENIPQINCHNSLQDAIWNFKAYQYIQNKIENGGKRST